MTQPHPFAGREIPGWYDDAKFGIFIHWGPYAVPCFAPVGRDMGEMMHSGQWEAAFRDSPYTEWYQNSWAIEGSAVAAHHEANWSGTTYADFVSQFRERAAGVNEDAWADLFAAAGARYVVPVTKHHDGFLMWDSATPNPHHAGWGLERDHVGALARAVRARGMEFGVYYSGGLDWTFSPPPITDFMSMVSKIPMTPDYTDYAVAHVDELVARYSPKVLWNDIAWPLNLDPNEVFARYYDAVPDGVVNDRWNLLEVRAGRLHADFATPEYSVEADRDRKWEVCRGIGRSFGYNRAEDPSVLPDADELVWMLVDIVSRGGNLLLNVGPTADGQIPLAQAQRLLGLGWWLRQNGDAIHGTRPTEQPTGTTECGRELRTTRSPGGITHVIVRGAPSGRIVVPGTVVGSTGGVTLGPTGRELPHRASGDSLEVRLPDHLAPSPATVISIHP